MCSGSKSYGLTQAKNPYETEVQLCSQIDPSKWQMLIIGLFIMDGIVARQGHLNVRLPVESFVRYSLRTERGIRVMPSPSFFAILKSFFNNTNLKNYLQSAKNQNRKQKTHFNAQARTHFVLARGRVSNKINISIKIMTCQSKSSLGGRNVV
jgi:hypothetical protein